MKYILLQDVHFTVFDSVPESGKQLGSDLVLTTSPTLASQLFSTVLAPAASLMHLEALKNMCARICVMNHYPQASGTLAQLTNLNETFILLSGLFLEALWLVKDNNVNASAAYAAMITDDGRPVQFIQPHSVVNSNSKRRKESLHFTAAELDAAIAYFKQMLDIMPKGVMTLGAVPPPAIIHASRIGRALYRVQPAGATSEVALKVAFYCIALETLFSTVDVGVSCCVATRTAAFLERDPSARKACHQVVRLSLHRDSRRPVSAGPRNGAL